MTTTTLQLTQQVIARLERLTETGLYGKTIGETAAILLVERLREILLREKPKPEPYNQ